MAYMRSYDAFDLRKVNLHLNTAGANLEIYSDATINGRTYQDVMSYIKKLDMFRSIDFLGSDLTSADGGFLPVSGTVNAIYTWFYNDTADQWYYNFFIHDISISATEIAAAMSTRSTTDDANLVALMLADSDKIILSRFADWVDGKTGDDTISGSAGNDSLLGSSGNDVLTGGTGSDLLVAGAGSDRLVGGSGNDRLAGTADLESDSFVFNRSSGADRITGFEDGFDLIVIESGATSIANLRITDAGADAVVRFGTVSITLVNVDHRDLGAEDFFFA